MALKKLKAWKVINGEAPVALDFYDDDPQALSAACKDWLLETSDEDDSIQLLTGKKKSAAEVWKQLESSFAVSGFASVEQQILKLQELSYSSSKSLQDFINQLTTAKEHLEDLSVHLPQSYYIVQLLRGLGRPFQSWAREVRPKDLNALDFESLCMETFNEEQSIKRNEA